MNIAEAMRALLDGKKIRSVKWAPDIFYSLENFGEIGETDIKQEFEIYEEPTSECEIGTQGHFLFPEIQAICFEHAKDEPNCELNKNSKPEHNFRVGDKFKFCSQDIEIVYIDSNEKIFSQYLGVITSSDIRTPRSYWYSKRELEKLEKVEEPKPEPKFNIGDKVLSLGGYYKGEKGEIISINKSGKYEVKFNASNMPCMPVTMLEKNLQKIEEEKTDIPPMQQKEISKEEFKKRYPDIEKEEWTYPCVVMHKNTRKVRIAWGPYCGNPNIIYDSVKMDAFKKADYKVIANDLRNLDL